MVVQLLFILTITIASYIGIFIGFTVAFNSFIHKPKGNRYDKTRNISSITDEQNILRTNINDEFTGLTELENKRKLSNKAYKYTK